MFLCRDELQQTLNETCQQPYIKPTNPTPFDPNKYAV